MEIIILSNQLESKKREEKKHICKICSKYRTNKISDLKHNILMITFKVDRLNIPIKNKHCQTEYIYICVISIYMYS